MTDLYDILETFAGTPGTDPFLQVVFYLGCIVFALLLFLGIIDIIYLFVRSVRT